MSIEREFIPYEQALALKELGFDKECFAGYDIDTTELYIGYENDQKTFNIEYYILAPLYQQAFRWFREKYGYFQLFDYQHGDSKINRGFFFNIVNIDNEDFFFPEDFENEIYKTYEEAELECLIALINIVKNGKK